MNWRMRVQKCPVCDQEKWRNRYRIDSWDITECLSCRFAKIVPFPEQGSRSEFYSEEAHNARTVRKKRSFFRQLSVDAKGAFKRFSSRDKYSIFYHKLSRYCQPGAAVLDVGCADGAFLDVAKERFVCTGIDISESRAALMKKKHENCEILIGDYARTDFQNRKYDGITLISLLEHLDNPLQALQKSFNILNLGGVLLLKTVNYASLNRKFRGKKWTGFRPPDHMVYFTPQNLKRLLQKVGFSKVTTHAQPLNDNMYCDAWR